MHQIQVTAPEGKGEEVGLSTIITIISGMLVATLTGGPLQHDSFSPPVRSRSRSSGTG
jgi:hypothetical protein